ncbi:MAG: DnaB-like helicase N-terminal domain-containing protein [Kiritimatiellia bacterium]|nr:DnaB-like helicase N-terminal domain-containing protein [Kiritimatiellia bacterium]
MPKTIDTILKWDAPLGPRSEPKPEVKTYPMPLTTTTFSEEAEMGMLGSILLEPEKVFGFCVKKQIKPDSFYLRHHQIIYKSMLDMNELGHPIDTMTLADRLKARGELDEIGGLPYLNRLLDSTPTSAHAEYYVDLVLDYHLKRQLEEIKRAPTNSKSAIESLNEIQTSIDLIRPHDTSFLVRSLTDYADSEIDPAKTLLGNRFLCDFGGMLLVGPSGVGKSSASVQQDILWSLGKSSFGISSARPLRITTVQAENDDGDLTEMARGIMGGLKLSLEEREQVRQNTCYISERAKTGLAFIRFIESVLRQTRPNILRIDPLQSYIGGDISDVEVVSDFLHVGLNPLLLEYNCAVICNHHTPKLTNRDSSKWGHSDFQYSGAGSALATNWARAIIVIDPCKDNDRLYRFIAAKRGWRTGWQDKNEQSTMFRYFKHSSERGVIFWEDANEDEVAATITSKKNPLDIIELMPPTGAIPKDELLSKAQIAGIGKNKARKFISELLEDKSIFEWHTKRPGITARVDLSRTQQPEERLDV